MVSNAPLKVAHAALSIVNELPALAARTTDPAITRMCGEMMLDLSLALNHVVALYPSQDEEWNDSDD